MGRKYVDLAKEIYLWSIERVGYFTRDNAAFLKNMRMLLMILFVYSNRM